MVQITNGQSLIDLAVQHTGSVESLFDWMHLNNLTALNQLPSALETPAVVNLKVVDFFKTERFQSATNVAPVGSFSNSFSNSFNN